MCGNNFRMILFFVTLRARHTSKSMARTWTAVRWAWVMARSKTRILSR
jgi:hypothetical protein